ncbi:PREDICTED: uncharacterized protein LOC106788329 [Polistes canadensis]|uniref:uncharacterized protein LOC106788329 n=1 Tax=Polistes canadensis TaxID=91411 RepID=UPI000718BD53|nr:PREDICTED: uncharacterized protein LOC106788329 [Polistes canadensis]
MWTSSGCTSLVGLQKRLPPRDTRASLKLLKFNLGSIPIKAKISCKKASVQFLRAFSKQQQEPHLQVNLKKTHHSKWLPFVLFSPSSSLFPSLCLPLRLDTKNHPSMVAFLENDPTPNLMPK